MWTALSPKRKKGRELMWDILDTAKSVINLWVPESGMQDAQAATPLYCGKLFDLIKGKFWQFISAVQTIIIRFCPQLDKTSGVS